MLVIWTYKQVEHGNELTKSQGRVSSVFTYTTLLPPLHSDIRWLLVQSDTKAFQFVRKNAEIVERFEHIQDDEDEVTGSRDLRRASII